MPFNAYNYYQIGGINRKLNPFLTNPSDLRLVRNYRSTIFYTKEKRKGYTKFLDNPDSSKVYGLIHFKRADSTRRVLRLSGTSIYSYAITGSTWGAAVLTGWGKIADPMQIISTNTPAEGKLDATTDYIGQGFKVGTTGTFPSIQLLIQKTASPGTLTVEIRTDNAGSPSGSVVTNGSLTIAASAISTSLTWVYASFATAPSLTAGTQYHLVIYAAGVSGTNYYQLKNSTATVYADGVFKYSTNSGGTWAAASSGDLAFVLYRLGGCRTGHTVLNGSLILGNGGNQPVSYDGSSFTTLTAAPIARYWVTVANRAWAAGIDTNPSAVYFSKVNDPTSWANDANDISTGGVVYVDPDNNGQIVALDKKLGRIIVHKEFGKYKILLDEFGVPSDVIDLENNEPAANNWGIIASGEYNYYLRENGVYRDQSNLPEIISLPLGDLGTNITHTNLIDAVSGTLNDFIHWSVGNITETDRLKTKTYTNCVLTYNKRTEEWSLDSLAHAPTAYENWLHTDDKTRLFFGDSAGNTFVFDDATVDGAGLATSFAIEGELVWHPLRFGDPAASKDFDSIFVYSEPGVGAIVSVKDEDDEPIALGSLEGGFLSYHLPEEVQDERWIEVSILDNSRSGDSRIYGFTIEASPANRR